MQQATNKLLSRILPVFKLAQRSRADLMPKYGPAEVVKIRRLNDLKVYCKKSENPLVACTVLFQFGSRHECDNELGVTHFIRAGSYTSSMSHSAFLKTRYLQQVGAAITCRTDRQSIAYTLTCPSTIFSDLIVFFVEGVIKCSYPEHELEEVRSHVRYDLTIRPPEQEILDLVQKACFTGSLNNSIYCSKWRIDEIDSNTIHQFIGCHRKTNICSVGSIGAHSDDIMKLANLLDCGRIDKPPKKKMPHSQFRGGYEYRDLGHTRYTYIALGVPGVGTCDSLCCLKYAILAASCGMGSVRQSQFLVDHTPNTPLSDLSADIPDTQFKAFNISYTDTGCFGLIIKARTPQAYCAAGRGLNFLIRLCHLTCEQIEAGKKRLKLGAALSNEFCSKASEDLALQAATNVSWDNHTQFAMAVDSIHPQEITTLGTVIATNCSYGLLGVAVLGDVGAAPCNKELLCG